MDERVLKFRVGVMVLATLFLGGILVLRFGDVRTLAQGHYTVYIQFDDAPGVTEGTPIRKSGILVGRVHSVKFSKEGGVVVEARIDDGVEIRDTDQPQISGSLLGGDVVIQFVHRPKAPAAQPQSAPPDGTSETRTQSITLAQAKQPPPMNGVIQPGDVIRGTVAPNAIEVFTRLEGDLAVAVRSLGNAGDEVSRLASYFNKLFTENQDQIDRIVNKTEQTLDSLQRTLVGAEDLIGDPVVRQNLKQTITDLPEVLADARGAMNTLRGTVESMDRNLRNLEGLTEPLGERGDQLVGNIDRAVGRLDVFLGNLSDFSNKLNRGEGTLGQLMSSDELYRHLNATICNLEQLTRELKPTLANARIFSDKIARHPELLGVRGVLQNNPGIK